MPARFDHHRVQAGDGYAAFVAGEFVGTEIGVTSDEQASWWGGRGIGTVPHALIAAYGGDTVLAAQKFADWAPPEMNVTVLVDFENDSIRTALDVADALGDRLWGVRLDTSESLVDRSLFGELGDFKPTGVNERLVWKVRKRSTPPATSASASSSRAGSPSTRSRAFEEAGVPVDAYGVGSSLIRGSNDFTGDIVVTDGKPSAKVGRHYRENPRLELRRREAASSGTSTRRSTSWSRREALRPGRDATSRRRWSGSSTRRAPRASRTSPPPTTTS